MFCHIHAKTCTTLCILLVSREEAYGHSLRAGTPDLRVDHILLGYRCTGRKNHLHSSFLFLTHLAEISQFSNQLFFVCVVVYHFKILTFNFS